MVEVALADPPDIEFPLKTRNDDVVLAFRGAGATDPSVGSRGPLPFLTKRLLSAQGPFGLDVEVKSEGRLVGTWAIEVKAIGVAHMSRARAHLYVCSSATGDPRATGAFLVVRHWSVRASDKEQLEQLYESLSVAALERLDSLIGGVCDQSDESCSCVLFLVDGRRLDESLFSLDRLQIRVLEDLESTLAIAGVDLRVAHGHGTGTRPFMGFSSTLSSPMQEGHSGLDSRDGEAAGLSRPHGPFTGEVFVRESLSPVNVRWNRRASDRLPVSR